MNLKEFISTSERGTAKKLAAFLGVSPSYLSQMASGESSISERRCVLIERFSSGKLSRRDLRPDDWQDIWPELAESLRDANSAADAQSSAGTAVDDEKVVI